MRYGRVGYSTLKSSSISLIEVGLWIGKKLEK